MPVNYIVFDFESLVGLAKEFLSRGEDLTKYGGYVLLDCETAEWELEDTGVRGERMCIACLAVLQSVN